MAARNSKPVAKKSPNTKPKYPHADIYAEKIKRVREGDIEAAKKMMLDASEALRDRLPQGGNNLAGMYADYLAEVLDRLAASDETARLFCLDMPRHRPKQHEDSPMHLERARKVLAKYQSGVTLDAAMKTVSATSTCVSIGAIRASWKAKSLQALVALLMETPKSKWDKVRYPDNHKQ